MTQHVAPGSELGAMQDQLRRVEETAADLRSNSDPRIISAQTLQRATLADSDPDWRNWPDVRPLAREVIYTSGSLLSADMLSQVRLADVDPADPVAVRLFEVHGDIENLAADAELAASHASLRYHILRHRRGLDPDAALKQALSEISPFWSSIPRRYLRVGQRIRFGTTRRLWHVQAVSDHFVALVQQAPFEPKGVLQYTVIDWARGIRGPANLIGWGYGDGTYSRTQCAAMLREFEYELEIADLLASGAEPTMDGLEVSHRNNAQIYEFTVFEDSTVSPA